MKWTIPAKTFLLGEYIAIAGGPAIVLTTTPCFELSLAETPGLHGIHKESPAGRYFREHSSPEMGLNWHDPYQGIGGLGASSAQFVAVYQALCQLQKRPFNADQMLQVYFQYAWSGVGKRPSGYDVLAQASKGCVSIELVNKEYRTVNWPFADIGFILLHTQKKLATHEHLNTLNLSASRLSDLHLIAKNAHHAFTTVSSKRLIQAINDYYQHLIEMNLVAPDTEQYISMLKQHEDILAIKGCGAMGADVILLIVPQTRLDEMEKHLAKKWQILGTHQTIFYG